MRPALAALCGVLVLASCGTDQASDPAMEERLAAAQVAATEARDALSALEERVADLELASARTEKQTEGLAARLDAALERIQDSLKGVRGDSAAAVEDAASALGQAYAVVRDLSVLENRFDYHLRRDHGGG